MKNKISGATILLALMLWAGSAQATLIGYTDKASFDAAIAGFVAKQTVNFDSLAAGTTIASGASTGGLTFNYAIAGPSMLRVSNTFGTTSASNYLGLDNADTAFYLGDSFTINFSEMVHAIGLYLIAGRDAQAGDLQLSVARGLVLNSALPDRLLSDGNAFYLGLVESDAELGFISANVQMVLTPNAFLAVTADDITSAVNGVSTVPEPATWGLMLAGMALLATLRRRRH